MLPVRVFFKKQGSLAYISHLDLNRAVLRAFVRAELPVVFTEGYNPHPKLKFSQPLSLFQESVTEIFEFKVDPDMSYDEIKSRLSAALPPEFEIIKVCAPVKKLSEVAFARYRITLKCNCDAKKIDELLNGKIVVRKVSKKRDAEVDITSQIKQFEARDIDGGVELETVLDTSSNSYLNPRYIVNYLSSKCVIDSFKILRLELYDSDMNVFE